MEIVQAAGKDSTSWIQDGDPSKNGNASKEAMHDVGAHLQTQQKTLLTKDRNLYI